MTTTIFFALLIILR